MKYRAPNPAHKAIPTLVSTIIAALACLAGTAAASADRSVDVPVRALLITGGGWHDYARQAGILTEGIAARANVDWTVVTEGMEGDNAERSSHKLAFQQADAWEADFDVIAYNICFGNVTDVAFIDAIAEVHEEGLPAVILHCTIHSYRNAETDSWRNLLGVVSNRHESHRPFTVENLAPDHPIMRPFPDEWETPHGELYMIEGLRDSVTPLARAYGVDTERHHVTVWTNRPGDGRIFGTTIGHHNETMAADEYLDLVSRGLLWTVGGLAEDGTPRPGFGLEEHPD